MMEDLPHKLRLYILAVAYVTLVSLVINELYGSTEAITYLATALVIVFIPLKYALIASLISAGFLSYLTLSYWIAPLVITTIYLSRVLGPAASLYGYVLNIVVFSVIVGGCFQKAWAVGLSALLGVLFLVHKIYRGPILESGLLVTAVALLYTLVIVMLRLIGSVVEGLLILGGASVSILLCLKVYEELAEKLTTEAQRT